MRILVTGGASLVGSHLVDRLLAEGHEVIAIDDLSRGSFANLAHLKREPRFVFHEHDVALPFRADVDAVYHLALPSSARSCEDDPLRAATTCVAGTANVLDAAARSGARVVLVTSVERAGEGLRCVESMSAHYQRRATVDVRVVRTATAFGPRAAVDGSDLVGALVLAALRGDELRVPEGTPEQIELAYVDDVVGALVHAMDADDVSGELEVRSVVTSPRELLRATADAAGLGSIVIPASRRGEGLDVGGGDPAAQRIDVQDGHDVASLDGGLTALAEGIDRTMRWLEGRMALSLGARGQSGVRSIRGRRSVPPPLPLGREARTA